jgi:hypothetical protein
VLTEENRQKYAEWTSGFIERVKIRQSKVAVCEVDSMWDLYQWQENLAKVTAALEEISSGLLLVGVKLAGAAIVEANTDRLEAELKDLMQQGEECIVRLDILLSEPGSSEMCFPHLFEEDSRT